MIGKVILTAVAAAALIPGSALAAPGGGHGGGPSAGGSMNANTGMGRAGAAAGANMGVPADMSGIGVQTRDASRINSQGPANASETGIAHANENSVLAGTSGATVLTGVTTGMAVMQDGSSIGTVKKVVTNGSGVITRVLVQGTNGKIYAVSPTNLTLSGGTLTTTAMLRLR